MSKAIKRAKLTKLTIPGIAPRPVSLAKPGAGR